MQMSNGIKMEFKLAIQGKGSNWLADGMYVTVVTHDSCIRCFYFQLDKYLPEKKYVEL